MNAKRTNKIDTTCTHKTVNPEPIVPVTNAMAKTNQAIDAPIAKGSILYLLETTIRPKASTIKVIRNSPCTVRGILYSRRPHNRLQRHNFRQKIEKHNHGENAHPSNYQKNNP